MRTGVTGVLRVGVLSSCSHLAYFFRILFAVEMLTWARLLISDGGKCAIDARNACRSAISLALLVDSFWIGARLMARRSETGWKPVRVASCALVIWRVLYRSSRSSGMSLIRMWRSVALRAC